LHNPAHTPGYAILSWKYSEQLTVNSKQFKNPPSSSPSPIKGEGINHKTFNNYGNFPSPLVRGYFHLHMVPQRGMAVYYENTVNRES